MIDETVAEKIMRLAEAWVEAERVGVKSRNWPTPELMKADKAIEDAKSAFCAYAATLAAGGK